MQKTFGRKSTILFTFPLFYVKIDKKVNHISDANGEKLSEVIMNKKKVALDYVILALGSILTALGVHFFKIPNNFSTAVSACSSASLYRGLIHLPLFPYLI